MACVILAGGAAIVHACIDLYSHPVDWQWFILAGLTLLSGSITVKVPSVPATISVSETFVFTAVMLFGPAAGTITVALDGLIISLWLQRKKCEAYKAFFNVAAPSLSLWASAQLYFALSNSAPLIAAPEVQLSRLFVPLVAFTLSYFLLNSSLIAIAISLEKRTPALKVWRENFFWLSLNFFSGASVAVLLVSYTRRLDPLAVGIIIPLLVISYLTYKTSMGRLEDTTKHLGELNLLYLSTIETLAMWIDAKDQITHGHIRRVQDRAVDLARELGVKDEKLIKAIEAAALLHDMGKLAVPEHILNKPGKLTPGEFEKMKLHASIGAQILSSIDFPYPVVPIVRHHHENWDGSGYPDGLAGTDIPIGARILAVVDCYDALTSDRPYRPKLNNDDAVRILALRRGSMYDPLVVDAFLRIHASRGGQREQEDGSLTGVAVLDNMHGVGHQAVDAGSRGVPVSSDAPMDLNGETGKKLLQLARLAIPVSLGVLFSHDSGKDTLLAVHTDGEGAEKIAGLELRVGQGVSGWVAANRRGLANADSFLDVGDAPFCDGAPLRSCLSVPVALGDALLGVVTLYSTEPNRFSNEERELLESHVLAFASDLGRRSIPLETAAPEVTASVALAHGTLFMHGQLNGQRVALLLLKTYSPISLDERTARQLAGRVDRILRGGLRPSDLTLRTASDEVAVVLPHVDAVTAKNTAQRLARAIADGLSEGNETPDVHLGVRYCLAISPDDGTSFESLFAAARRSASIPPCGCKEQHAATVH